MIKVDENSWESNPDYGYTSVYDEDTDEYVYTYYKWTDIKDATADTYAIASVTDTAEKQILVSTDLSITHTRQERLILQMQNQLHPESSM